MSSHKSVKSERLFVEKLLSAITMWFNNKTSDQPQVLNLTQHMQHLFPKTVKQELQHFSMAQQAPALSFFLSHTHAMSNFRCDGWEWLL